MEWEENPAALSFAQQEMTDVVWGKIPLNEMVQSDHPNKQIPTLRSVLSYVMMQCRSGYGGLWCRYRILLEMAKNTGRWYYNRWIPKANGGVRRLCVPLPDIRDQQQYIKEKILDKLPVDDHAFAYRKGVRMEDCGRPHTGQDVLLHLDIADFFGSITENMVFRTLHMETGYAKSLCRFLAQLCCFRGRLPQGAVTSPVLSNVVFRTCDTELAKLADRYGMRYSRYSDDLFFSGNEDVNVASVLKDISGILAFYGFKLNTPKTQIRRRQHRQTVLGLTVNDHIQVNRAYRRNLVQELHYLERFGAQSKGAVESGDYYRYLQTLQGKLAYVMRFDPDNSKWRNAHQNLTLRMNRLQGS